MLERTSCSRTTPHRALQPLLCVHQTHPDTYLPTTTYTIPCYISTYRGVFYVAALCPSDDQSATCMKPKMCRVDVLTQLYDSSGLTRQASEGVPPVGRPPVPGTAASPAKPPAGAAAASVPRTGVRSRYVATFNTNSPAA